jgi:hypothetical protein
MIVYCDNISVVYLSANPIDHPGIKHIYLELILSKGMLVRDLNVPL